MDVYVLQQYDEKCQLRQNVMIDVIARLGDVTSQRLINKHVLRTGSEHEIERVLFQYTALDHPIKVQYE